MDRIAIVGGSLAGNQAASSLSRAGFEGEVVVVSGEPHLPYDRPPLSKKFLAGDPADTDPPWLRRSENDRIEWSLGHAAVGLELSSDGRSTITLDNGSLVRADGLVIATGLRARTLPDVGRLAGAHNLGGVHTLRNLADAEGLRSELRNTPGSLVVVGCGFIGAEVASTAREMGWAVTIIEAADTPLQRVLDAEAGNAIGDLHRRNGVDVRLGTTLDAVIGSDESNRVEAVELGDRTRIECSVLVVGIGAIPNTEWLESSNLKIDNGVVCDSTLLAAPGVVAAGDVARWPNERFGLEPSRVEQWDNAVSTAEHAAGTLLAWADGRSGKPYTPVPWFWSDQYDKKIMLAGNPTRHPEVLQGGFDEQRVVQMYVSDDDKLTGVFVWNRPRQAVIARQLIEAEADAAEAREQLS